MNAAVKAPKKVTVTPADPKYTQKDIRKQHLRVAPYCRVSTGSEEQQTSFTAQMEYYTQRIADTEGWTMVRLYADEGITGTSTKKRTQFNKMIRDAEKGKIDLVITKSVSRFCRNTLDGLEYIRRLKKCGVGVYFEKENTNTLYMPNEMILTFLMSQAQAESESMSTNIQWGHRARFKQGIVHYNFSNFLGYRKGPDGEPEIDEEEAPTVRRIFARYLMGQSVGQICRDLTADGCKTARGGTQWSDHTVRHILQNEKYMGDAILQKTFTLDLFSRQQVKNEGQLPKYYVENAHVPIIDRDTFQKVQEEMARRSSLRKTSDKTKTEQGKYSGKYALGGLLVCGECGSPYRRVTYMPHGKKRYVWRCINRLEHGKKICKCAPTLEEPDIHAAVTVAMNELFRQQAARQALADCIAAALAGAGDDASLPAVEAKLRALQEEQMRLFRLAAEAGPENTEYDDRIAEVIAAMSALLAREVNWSGRATPILNVTAGCEPSPAGWRPRTAPLGSSRMTRCGSSSAASGCWTGNGCPSDSRMGRRSSRSLNAWGGPARECLRKIRCTLTHGKFRQMKQNAGSLQYRDPASHRQKESRGISAPALKDGG